MRERPSECRWSTAVVWWLPPFLGGDLTVKGKRSCCARKPNGGAVGHASINAGASAARPINVG
jgi:hypothetical protein